jgi:CRP-like cAMP-binding protein
VQVRLRGRELGTLQPGQSIGTGSALLGEPSPVDAVVVEPARYMCWPLSDIRAFLDRKPDLRVALTRLTNQELARKLQQAADVT